MSANYSSNSNASLLHLQDPLFGTYTCVITRPGSTIFSIYCIASTLLLLPLCTFILYLGLQRWRQQRSATTATTSHSDVFTYHMVIMELLGVLGCILFLGGFLSGHVPLLLAGHSFWSLTWSGEIFFHILTCFERYLAVVHPITYMKLRGERGIRIRNISIGCVWLLNTGGRCALFFIASLFFTNKLFMLLSLIVSLILSLIFVSFCSLSVLGVLIRPGPGEQGGVKKRVDQSKQRAFYTILAILAVLLLKFIFNLMWCVFALLDLNHDCVMTMSGIWFNLPSSLVLILLFLYRAGKCVCCKNNTK